MKKRHPEKQTVRNWLILNHDSFSTATEAAEEAAYHFNMEKWLDNETHWIWELAAELNNATMRPVV